MVEILEGVGPLAAFRRGNGVVVKVDYIRQAIFLTLSGIKAQRIGIQGIGRKIHRKPSALVYLVKASLPVGGKLGQGIVDDGKYIALPPSAQIVTLVVGAQGEVPIPCDDVIGRIYTIALMGLGILIFFYGRETALNIDLGEGTVRSTLSRNDIEDARLALGVVFGRGRRNDLD